MRHVHYDERAGGRVPGYTAWTAYLRLVASVLGAVALTTVLWAGWLHQELRIQLLRNAIPPADLQGLLSALWGVELTGNLAVDSVAFAVSRLASPWVLGPIVVAGLVVCLTTR